MLTATYCFAQTDSGAKGEPKGEMKQQGMKMDEDMMKQMMEKCKPMMKQRMDEKKETMQMMIIRSVFLRWIKFSKNKIIQFLTTFFEIEGSKPFS